MARGLGVLLGLLALSWATAQPPPGPFGPYTELASRQQLGAYVLEQWRGGEEPQTELARLIGPGGEIIDFEDVRVYVSEIADRSGAIAYRPGDDIDGNGVPDLVLEGFSLGAHCCFRYEIYELGPEPRLLFAAVTADAGLAMEDLDGDGVLELLTRDMSFAYAFCSFAFSPAPRVVLMRNPQARDPGEGYVVANDRFPEVFTADIAHDLIQLLEHPDEVGELHGCAVVALVLDLLYAGHEEAAWQALATFADPDTPTRQEIEAIVQRSPWRRP